MNAVTVRDVMAGPSHPSVAQRDLSENASSPQGGPHQQAEHAGRNALEFNGALLHEVNHRAKNTLQAAASLLSMHARATSSAQVREALQDSYRRLQLLARAHEMLYSNADSAQQILMPGLLQTVCDALEQWLSDASSVRLQLTCEGLLLPADTAIAIALFANEAVTNACKHAFPNDSAGLITVDLSRTPENALMLRIADTGIGMDPTSTADGMGLKLLRLFATQLHGTVTFAARTEGAGTVITLAIANSPASAAPDKRRPTKRNR